MGEEANCDAVMEDGNGNGNGKAKENGHATAVVAMPDVKAKAEDAVVAPGDPRLQGISDAIRVVPHFPKQGIMFNDITTLLLRPGVFKDALDMFVERYRGMGIAAVAGIEARGFIFGPAIALAIGAKFIPLRKPKKLPGEVISETYVLEYGTDCLEMHVGAIEPRERVLIVDDLVATGGTLCAAINLLERAGADVVECACLIGLPKFKDFYKLNGKPVYVLVESLEYEK
ncbi:hypothetical protein CFC21_083726 [Triticum aestivum]|uniref:adenine phosphoribosyltransferase n=3 Tax=Triticum TaxID=4564 RepID=A0A9R0Y387_TRITD|nr:adenine phosphoribosyltransferase 2-like isoform X2 [Triticum aestivum]XP_044403558.1 adenine phosphoribosyltransferase 2-like isoform X2 [Triticum aestivum]KAF7079506.1 hypothetical protein CFC21_083726 [Triticum aestivum]VAI47257.1 unnamed protein product [Triticum turgidum subsp. durum]